MADEPPDDDLVELGGRELRWPGWLRSRLPSWRPARGAAVFAAAALVIGLAAGYAAGDRHARGAAALPGPTVPVSPPVSQSVSPPASPASAPAPGGALSFVISPAIIQGTGACAVQTGRELQLGVQVTNQSTAVVTLRTARAVLPLGGLRQVTWQWATCGAISAGPAQADAVLLPGQGTWLSATFTVQRSCPAPLPVQFTVGYLAQGKAATARLPGFPDLGQVPYSGCPRTASS
jgi:hypothetical protein